VSSLAAEVRRKDAAVLQLEEELLQERERRAAAAAEAATAAMAAVAAQAAAAAPAAGGRRPGSARKRRGGPGEGDMMEVDAPLAEPVQNGVEQQQQPAAQQVATAAQTPPLAAAAAAAAVAPPTSTYSLIPALMGLKVSETRSLWQQLWCTCAPALELLLPRHLTSNAHFDPSAAAADQTLGMLTVLPGSPLALASAAAGHQLQLAAAGVAGAPQVLHAAIRLLRAAVPPSAAAAADGALSSQDASLFNWEGGGGSGGGGGGSEGHAVAALQLIRALVLLDGACSRVADELLGMRQARQQQQQQRRRGGGAQQQQGGSAAASSAAAAWGLAPPAVTTAAAGGGGGGAAGGPVRMLVDEGGGGGSSPSAAGGGSTDDEQRDLQGLVLEASKLGDGALLAAAHALGAAASQPPSGHRALLPALSSGALAQLLHHRGRRHRCAGVVLLAQLLRCPAVCDVLSSALAAEGGSTADGWQRQGPPSAATDACDSRAALQPSTGTQQPPQHAKRKQQQEQGAGQAHQQKQAQQHQHNQQQQHAVAALEDGKAASGSGSQPRLAALVSDVLLGLLDCLSSSLDGSRRRQGQQGEGGSGSSSSDGCGSSVHAAAGLAPYSWGAFELQRRALAAVAGLVQARQATLLSALLLSDEATGGEGLAQRLLVLANAACSRGEGDPLSWVAAPLALCSSSGGSASAAAAAGAGQQQACGGGNIRSSSGDGFGCGACSGEEWCERLRLAREALLLARMLTARGDHVGEPCCFGGWVLGLIMRVHCTDCRQPLLTHSQTHPRPHPSSHPPTHPLRRAANAVVEDLMASPASLRLALTATAKLAEWARCSSSSGTAIISSSSSSSSGALPLSTLQLAPWAEGLANCSSSSGSSGTAAAADEALKDIAAAVSSLRWRLLQFTTE